MLLPRLTKWFNVKELMATGLLLMWFTSFLGIFTISFYIMQSMQLTNKLSFRALATMGLGCNYVLLDAQTIQMIKVDEAQGKKGSLGRQYVFQVIIGNRFLTPFP